MISTIVIISVAFLLYGILLGWVISNVQHIYEIRHADSNKKKLTSYELIYECIEHLEKLEEDAHSKMKSSTSPQWIAYYDAERTAFHKSLDVLYDSIS